MSSGVLPSLDCDGKYPWNNIGLDGPGSSYSECNKYFHTNICADQPWSRWFRASRPSGHPKPNSADVSFLKDLAFFTTSWTMSYEGSYEYGKCIKGGTESKARNLINSSTFAKYCNNLFNAWCQVPVGSPDNEKRAQESARDLAALVSGNAWIINVNTLFDKGAVSNYDPQMNIVLWKIHSMAKASEADSLLQSTLSAWEKGIKPQYMKDIRYQGDDYCGNLVAKNIRGKFRYDVFWDFVHKGCTTPGKCWDLSYPTWQDAPSYTNWWGYDVWFHWIQGPNAVTSKDGELHRRGYYTGHKPTNYQVVSNSSGGCFSATTTVSTISIGKGKGKGSKNKNDNNKSEIGIQIEMQQIEISKVSEGSYVIGGNGRVGVRSEEVSSMEVQPNGTLTLYGFNDEEPFFSDDHPFMTPDGWKAVNPKAAKEENPFLTVGELKEGDSVYRIRKMNAEKKTSVESEANAKDSDEKLEMKEAADDDEEEANANDSVGKLEIKEAADEDDDEEEDDADPEIDIDIEYEEIEICGFTTRVLFAGATIFGLHLENSNSYHANGYLVAMNYPKLTGKRLADGIKKRLSDAEKEELAKTFMPAMPLLQKALGSMIAEPLREAFNGIHAKGATSTRNERGLVYNDFHKYLPLKSMRNRQFDVRCKVHDSVAKDESNNKWFKVPNPNIKEMGDDPSDEKDEEKPNAEILKEIPKGTPLVYRVVMDDGDLIVNDVRIENAMIRNSLLTFVTAEMSGSIVFSKDLLSFKGRIDFKGAARKKAELEETEEMSEEKGVEEKVSAKAKSKRMQTFGTTVYVSGVSQVSYACDISDEFFDEFVNDPLELKTMNGSAPLTPYTTLNYGWKYTEDGQSTENFAQFLDLQGEIMQEVMESELTMNVIDGKCELKIESMYMWDPICYARCLFSNGALTLFSAAFGLNDDPQQVYRYAAGAETASKWAAKFQEKHVSFAAPTADGYESAASAESAAAALAMEARWSSLISEAQREMKEMANMGASTPHSDAVFGKLLTLKNEMAAQKKVRKSTSVVSRSLRSAAYGEGGLQSKAKGMAKASDDSSMSVEQLYSIAVDPDELNKVVNVQFYNNAMFCVGKTKGADYLEKWFALNKLPPADDPDKVMLGDAQKMYINYANGFLGTGIDTQINYYGPNGDYLNAPEKRRLLEYFNTVYIGSRPAFSSEMERLYAYELPKVSTSFAPYAKDKATADYWANELYEYCVLDAVQLENIAGSTMSQGTDLLNRLSLLFNSLWHPEMAEELQVKVNYYIMMQTAFSSLNDPNAVSDSMDAWYRSMLDNVMSGMIDPSEDQKLITDAINDLIALEMENNAALSRLEAMTIVTKSLAVASMSAFAKKYTKVLDDYRVSFQKMFDEYKDTDLKTKISDKWDEMDGWNKMGKFLHLGFTTLVLLQLIIGWDEMSTLEKVMNVTIAVTAGVEAVKIIGSLGKSFFNSVVNKTLKFAPVRAFKESFKSLAGSIGRVMKNIGNKAINSFARLGEMAAGKVGAFTSKLSSFMGKAGKALVRAIGPVVAILCAAIILKDGIKLLEAGGLTAGQTTILVMQMVVAVAEVVVAVGTFVVGGMASAAVAGTVAATLAAALPIAGAVLAVIGIVFMVLWSIFKPKPDPNQELVDWMKDNIDNGILKIEDLAIPNGYCDAKCVGAADHFAETLSNEDKHYAGTVSTIFYGNRVVSANADDEYDAELRLSVIVQQNNYDPSLTVLYQMYHVLVHLDADDNYSVKGTPTLISECPVAFPTISQSSFFKVLQVDSNGKGIYYWNAANNHKILRYGQIADTEGQGTQTVDIDISNINAAGNLVISCDVFQNFTQPGMQPTDILIYNFANDARLKHAMYEWVDPNAEELETHLVDKGFISGVTGIDEKTADVAYTVVREDGAQRLIWFDPTAESIKCGTLTTIHPDAKYVFEVAVFQKVSETGGAAECTGGAWNGVLRLTMNVDFNVLIMEFRKDNKAVTPWESYGFGNDEFSYVPALPEDQTLSTLDLHPSDWLEMPADCPWVPKKAFLTISNNTMTIAGGWIQHDTGAAVYHGANSTKTAVPSFTKMAVDAKATIVLRSNVPSIATIFCGTIQYGDNTEQIRYLYWRWAANSAVTKSTLKMVDEGGDLSWLNSEVDAAKDETVAGSADWFSFGIDGVYEYRIDKQKLISASLRNAMDNRK